MLFSPRFSSVLSALGGAALTLASTSCGDGQPAGCDIYVIPGDDDQTTVNDAITELEDGDTFCFGPGTYAFTGELAFGMRSGVTVRGTGTARGDVVLDFTTQTVGAKGLSFTNMDDLTVENLTVLDTPGDNIWAAGSTNITMRNLSSGWVSRPMEARGRYAIYPVDSTNVLVENVEAFGSSDAGIYVGQATNCIVRNSVARENVAGIEIENSLNCEVYDNQAHDNTGGILVFELPGLPLRGAGTSVHDNVIENNNTPNFAEAGTIVSFLPPGTGLMLLAANDVEVHTNVIRGNASTGALIISYDTAEAAGAGMASDPDYDPETNDVWLHDNTFENNGQMPDMENTAIAAILLFGSITTLEDVLWDGDVGDGETPMTLCLEGELSFRNIDAPGSFSTPTTDRAPHMCMGTPRPEVMF